ncbi:hypothetical protein CE91St64_04510 [Faecalicatena contorta]|nr:hypothetical protein CE91St64_04510 [Faecalicatena contorta]
MTNQSTMNKLIEMRLSAMADVLRNQLSDPRRKFRSKIISECWLISNTAVVKAIVFID